MGGGVHKYQAALICLKGCETFFFVSYYAIALILLIFFRHCSAMIHGVMCRERCPKLGGLSHFRLFPPLTVTPRVQGLGSAAGPVPALYQSLCRSYAASWPTGSKPKIVYKQY